MGCKHTKNEQRNKTKPEPTNKETQHTNIQKQTKQQNQTETNNKQTQKNRKNNKILKNIKRRTLSGDEIFLNDVTKIYDVLIKCKEGNMLSFLTSDGQEPKTRCETTGQRMHKNTY